MLTYGYEKGSTSGNEKYFDFFSSILPCPLSLVLFLSYRSGSAYALTRWSLVEGFFFRVAVYVCVCVFEKG